MKSSIDFFRHDINAQQDLKIRRIIRDHGYEGYGVYWHVVEILYMCNGSTPYEDLKAEISGVAPLAILDSLIDSGLLHLTEDNMVVSDRVMKEFGFAEERRQRYSEMGKLSASKRSAKVQPKLNVGSTQVEESKEKQKRFVPPTLEEIAAFCKERGNNVDPKKVFDYYSEGKWKGQDGKPVRNWKQKIIAVWERDKRPVKQTVCNDADKMRSDMNANGGFDL